MGVSKPQVSFGDALTTAVRGLWGQPPLLAAVAIAIVLATVAVASEGAARAISTPLLAILVIGVAAWVYTDARRVQRREPGVFENTRLGRWSSQEDVTIDDGAIDQGAGDRIERNVELGAGAKQKGVTIKRGKITQRRR